MHETLHTYMVDPDRSVQAQAGAPWLHDSNQVKVQPNQGLGASYDHVLVLIPYCDPHHLKGCGYIGLCLLYRLAPYSFLLSGTPVKYGWRLGHERNDN